jgi:hypothetical protein
MGAPHSRIESVDRPLSEAEEVAVVRSAWRQAEAECGRALEQWNAATTGGKPHAYKLYRDALEYEARAADALAEVLGRCSCVPAHEALAAA